MAWPSFCYFCLIFISTSSEKEATIDVEQRWRDFCKQAIDEEIVEKRGKQRMSKLVALYTKMFPDEEHG